LNIPSFRLPEKLLVFVISLACFTVAVGVTHRRFSVGAASAGAVGVGASFSLMGRIMADAAVIIPRR
jgi:hypothetical protein